MQHLASHITSLRTVYSKVYSGADQRKHQSSMSLAFVRGIHHWPVNSPHKGPVMEKMFPFDGIIIKRCTKMKHYKYDQFLLIKLTISQWDWNVIRYILISSTTLAKLQCSFGALSSHDEHEYIKMMSHENQNSNFVSSLFRLTTKK